MSAPAAIETAPLFREEEHEGERKINRLRLAGIFAFFLNEMFVYHGLGAVDAAFHSRALMVCAAWMLFALAAWWAVSRRGFYHRSVKYAVSAADALFLFWLLAVADGPSSPVVPAFYVLIAFSALRYSRKATFACAVFSAAAFLGLQYEALSRRPDLALPAYAVGIHLLSMLLMGAAAGYVVSQLQALVGRAVSTLIARQRAEDALSRYVSRQVASHILAGEKEIWLAGSRREVAVLMSDIRGFTPMSEKMDPEALVSLLNRYFKVMIDIVFKHDGMLDKFVGDEIMVVFGAPLDQPDAETRAFKCAAEMQKAMGDFNAGQRAAGGPELGVGIAVHSGPVVAGNVGSETRMDYTVMGDTVNMTQRMQARAAAGKVLVSDAAKARAGEGFSYTELEPFQVKGRQEPVKAFELLF